MKILAKNLRGDQGGATTLRIPRRQLLVNEPCIDTDVDMKLDQETQKQFSDAEEVALMIKSNGWAVVHSKLQDKILDLQNINNIDASDTSTLSTQILGRKLASDLLFAWLRADVFGLVEQAEANRQQNLENREEYLERH